MATAKHKTIRYRKDVEVWLAQPCQCGHSRSEHMDTRPHKTYPCLRHCRCLSFRPAPPGNGGRWDAEHYTYQCSDGEHNSYWRTVVESPEWHAWTREVARRLKRLATGNTRRGVGPVFDVDECQEAGWISPAHFKAFVQFCRTRKARDARQKHEQTITPDTSSVLDTQETPE